MLKGIGHIIIWGGIGVVHPLSHVYRDFVQKATKLLDPEGVKIRKQRRLKRRVYLNRVRTVHVHAC